MTAPSYVNGTTPVPAQRGDLFPVGQDTSRYWDAASINALSKATAELLVQAQQVAMATNYGFACDGATDDFPALTAFIAASGSKAMTLVIPAPCKVGTNITIPTTLPVRFEGAGAFTGAGVVTYSAVPAAANSASMVLATGSSTARTLAEHARALYHAGDTVVNVKGPPYNAYGDGTHDDTAAIQAAVKAAGLAFAATDWFAPTNPVAQAPQVVKLVPGATYKIASGPVFIPQGVILDGQNATVIGTGHTSGGGTLFESGYFSGGNLVTNWGTTTASHRLIATKIRNIRFAECNIALRLFDFYEGSALENLTFYGCVQDLVASNVTYSRIHNLFSRWPASYGANSSPAYSFNSVGGAADTNVTSIDSLFAEGGGVRAQGILIDGGVQGLHLRNFSAEAVTNGLKVLNETHAFSIEDGYFEGITGTAIDMTAASSHTATVIDKNWFYAVGVAIDLNQMIGGRVGQGNHFDPGGTGVPVKVRISDDTTSTAIVEIPALYVNEAVVAGTTTTPIVNTVALPSGYTLGKKCNVAFPAGTANGGTGLPSVSGLFTTGLAGMPFTGNQGHAANSVPFATVTKVGTTTYTLTVDTQIVFDIYVMGVFFLNETDNNGVWKFQGRFYGTDVYLDSTAAVGGRTVTVSNQGGFVRLTLGTFAHPTGYFALEGIVRHM